MLAPDEKGGRAISDDVNQPDQPADLNPPDTLDAPTADTQQQEERKLWERFVNRVDAIPYWIVGAVFWLAALLSLAYGLSAFVLQILAQTMRANTIMPQLLIDQGQGAQDIINLVSDLLLTLIIMEVFGTVVHYLRERETTLRPFLFIGIISATRGILSIGARLAVGNVQGPEFARDMLELGVDGAVIIALAVAMNLIGTFLDQGATPTRKKTAPQSRPPRDRQPTQPLPATRNAGATASLPAGWLGLAILVVIVLIVLVSLGLVATLLHL